MNAFKYVQNNNNHKSAVYMSFEFDSVMCADFWRFRPFYSIMQYSIYICTLRVTLEICAAFSGIVEFMCRKGLEGILRLSSEYALLRLPAAVAA